MLIIMLAASMTLAMLIATAVAVHNESQRVQERARISGADRFGYIRRR